MKKIALIFFILFGMLALQANAFTIKLKMNGIHKDSSCTLGYYFGQKSYTPVDTVKIDDSGTLVFSGKDKLKQGVYLVVTPKIYVELIVADEQDIRMETDTANIILNMKIKGSAESELFYSFQKYMMEKGTLIQDMYKKDKTDPKIKELQVEIQKFRTDFFTKNANTLTAKILRSAEEPEIPDFRKPNGQIDSVASFNYYRNHFFDLVDFSDERLLRTPVFIPKLERFMKELTVQSPDSVIKSLEYLANKASASKEIYKYVVATMTNTYETSNIMGMDAVFVHMADNFYLKGKCFWIDTTTERKIRERANILRPLLLGKMIPNTYCTDTASNYVPLHSLKAKYTIIVFWDADCGHCQKEIPKLFSLYNSVLKKYGAIVYAATIERDDKSWPKFLKEKKLFAQGWYNVRDKKNHTDFNKTFDVYSTPVFYIIDEKKVIIAKRLGVDQMEDFFLNYEKRKK